MIPFTTIPIISAFFLILIGVLIGHLVWFRFRDDPESMFADQGTLEKERASHERLVKAFEELKTKHSDRGVELESLKAARTTLESQWHNLQSEHDQLKSESTRFKHERDTAKQASEAETRKASELQRNLDQARTALAKAEATVENLESKSNQFANEVSKSEGKISGLAEQMGDFQDRYAQTIDRLQAAEREKSESQKQANELRTRLAEASADLKQERQQRSEFERKHNDQIVEITRLEAVLDRLAGETNKRKQSEAEVAQLTKRIDAIVHERDAAKADAIRKADEMARLRQDGAERQSTLQSLRSRVSHLTSALQSEKSKTTKVYANSLAAHAVHQPNQDSEETTLLRESLQKMQITLDDAQRKYEQKKREYDEAVSQLQAGDEEFDRLQDHAKRQEEMLQTLQQQNTELQHIRESAEQRCEELETQQEHIEVQLRDHADRLVVLTNQRDAAMSKLTNIESQASEAVNEAATVAETTRQQQADVERDLIALGQELSELRGSLDEERRLRSQLEIDLEARDTELTHLRNQTAELPNDGKRMAELQAAIKTSNRQIAELKKQNVQAQETEQATKEIAAELRSELGDRLAAIEALERVREEAVETAASEKQARLESERRLQKRIGDTERELHGLRSRAQQGDETIRQLRRERGEILSRANPKKDSPRQFITLSNFKNLDAGTGQLDEVNKVRFDEDLGPIYKAAPTSADDLKLISGIADILEEKLNELGVYKYQQIMQWDDLNVEEFSKLLAFRDRIQRDNWIGQARRLHREHHGKRAA